MVHFSPQQQLALNDIRKWYNNEKTRPYILNGYAGTGKTTIARYIYDYIDCLPKQIIYVAYTGKAASNLRKKGCDGATTIHKLLYNPVTQSKEELDLLIKRYEELLEYDPHEKWDETKSVKRKMIAEEKRVSEVNFEFQPDLERIESSKIIIVDESSMLNEKIAHDLRKTGLPIIYCGDPFQLPPVKGTSPISTIKPDYMLTEVHRQGLNSPVLRFATDLRNNKITSLSSKIEGAGDNVLEIIRRNKVDYNFYNSHDQIICGYNRTRYEYNQKMRNKKIEEGIVTPIENLVFGVNDKIMFRTNDYENNIFNGMQGVFKNGKEDEKKKNYLKADGLADSTEFSDYEVYDGYAHSGKPPFNAPRFSQCLDHGYAITCHKSQGSEWPSVIIINEPVWGNDPKRWLYTAVTRAQNRCTIVIPGR